MGTLKIKEPCRENFYDYLESVFRKYNFKTRIILINFEGFCHGVKLKVYDDKFLWRLRKPIASLDIVYQTHGWYLHGKSNYEILRDPLMEITEGNVDITIEK